MKCPHCGAWNKAYLPKCIQCGAALEGNQGQNTASWETSMHKKKPSLTIVTFDQDDPDIVAATGKYDPEHLDRAELTDELEELLSRREAGSKRIEQMKQQAQRVQRSIRETEIIRPAAEDSPAQFASDSAVIRRRQTIRQQAYTASHEENTSYIHQPDEENGYIGNPSYEQPLAYDDDDETAPVFFDGYVPESGDQGALTDKEYMPRRIQTRAANEAAFESFDNNRRRKNKALRVIAGVMIVLVCCAAVGVGGILLARQYIMNQGMQVRKDNDTQIELEQTTVDGHPAHTITIYGKENATIYLREMQSSYIIADGKVSITIPDYMWYDTESSTFATPVDTDTMDVSITPFIRYSQEGDQYQLEPIEFTIDVPLSPIYLLNPSTTHADVGVSIYEVRINVQPGSTVIIGGSNVSTLIRETGNVSKNVPVLPVGDNTISISVKSKYCRENTMEVVLYRAPQDIPLEVDATVMVEWNYEPITEERYTNATDEERAKMQLPLISGTTLPGATVTVEFPHWDFKLDSATGKFSFRPLLYDLGNNEIPIRASYEGKTDSVISHVVYYMPNADIYTRKAWDLDTQYTDLINYIGMRKGTIYVGTGVITKIISTAPQMAIMDIGNGSFEKLVMLENSSKTTWSVGTRYRVYGEAYGMYDTMPRLTVRYTYLIE